MKLASIFLALAALAGCQKDASVPTAEENAQLDDAANLLNEAPADLEGVDDGGLGSTNEAETP